MKDTRIVSCAVERLEAELFQPFTISSGSHSALENVLFTVKLANGVKGYGEAAVAPHITGETIEMTERNLKKAAAALAGKDAADYSRLLCRLEDMLEDNRCALAGAQMAVLDAVSRHLGMPFWAFYGRKPNRVRTDITLVIGGLDEAYSFTRRMKARGFSIFKIKTGRDYDLDIKRVLAVAETAPKAGIYLDANGAYDAKTAERFVNDLARRGVRPEVIEQPVKKDDYEGLAYLSRKLKMPVCADESAYSLDDAVRVIKKKQATAINIKLIKLGLMRAREVHALALAAGVKLMIGEMLESELSSAAAAHFAGGLGGFDYLDLDTPFFIRNRKMKLAPGLLSKDGVYSPGAAKAGIGVTPI